VTKSVEATNRAGYAFCTGVVHRSPFEKHSGVSGGAGEEVWPLSVAEGDRHHPLSRVKTKREMRRAGVAEPEVFPATELPPGTVETGVEIRRKSFRQKKLAFAQRSERNCACRVGAFVEHGLGPIFFLLESCAESSTRSARESPKYPRED
jgi:hypothetical protein